MASKLATLCAQVGIATLSVGVWVCGRDIMK